MDHRVLRLILLFALLLAACTPIRPPVDGTVPPVENGTIAPTSGTIPPLDLALDASLPLDPNLRVGRLANGLTYYLRQNGQPAGRVELRLAVNAGSTLEDEDQRGVAHLLEHLLFNGTERFPEHQLIEFLESLGMGFGPDLNAYTSFDETVYQLQVPTDDPAVLERAFDVLEDWAAYATLDPAELESERGVVIEEWRVGDANASGRILRQLLPVLMGDSQYATRLPIGDPEVVRTVPVETVRRFYTDWYRPDLMAIIAVGDLDLDVAEAAIQARFNDLPAPEDPRERVEFTVPEHAEPRYLVVSDPEQSTTEIQVYIKRAAEPFTTVENFQDYLLSSLFYQMLNGRLGELGRQAEPPFVTAYATQGSFVRPLEATYYYAQVPDDGIVTGLTTLVTEIERVRLHGFTETELERAKRTILRSFEQSYNERNDTDSAVWAGYYADVFLGGDASTSAEDDYALAQALLPELSLAEVNAQVDDLVASENRVVIVTAPASDAVALPSETELAAIYSDVQATTIEPYVDQVVDVPLVAEPPTPVEITDQSELEALAVTTIELANGVRVLMKPTDFQGDEVLFTASSPGGRSLLSDEDYWEGWLVDLVVTESGVGELNQTELDNLLAGNTAAVEPYIGALDEGLTGSSSPADLETLFQLIYLYATQPRLDEASFAAVKTQWVTDLRNRLLDPINVLSDATNRALYGDGLRYRWPTVAEIESIDPQRAYEIYQERFADMDDFTFVFVGNFEEAALASLAQQYLGALPSQPTSETYRDLSSPFPSGIIEEVVYAGQDEQSIVQLIFAGPADASEVNQQQLGALRRVLDLMTTRTLREELGGTYGAYVGASMSVEPTGRYLFVVQFGCDPQKVDEMVAALLALIVELQENGPAAADVNTVNQQIARTLEVSLEQNNWWLGQLDYFSTTPDRSLEDLRHHVETPFTVTAEEIQATAMNYLPLDNYLEIVLYPAAYQE